MNTELKHLGLSLLAAAVLTAATRGEDSGAWPALIENFREPKPGEHPRLFFRKGDLPALRRRLQTPEGEQMVARLRQLLGNGGEELPRFEKIIPLNLTMDRTRPGHFTIGHPAGYGMLYQLTGKKKYAGVPAVLILSTTDPPTPQSNGNTLRIGGQPYTGDGTKLHVGGSSPRYNRTPAGR